MIPNNKNENKKKKKNITGICINRGCKVVDLLICCFTSTVNI